MPKDYRERRIDIEPPKLRAKNTRGAATSSDPESAGMDVFPVDPLAPVVTIAPGDGVLWFLRQPNGDTAPSGRNAVLTTLDDVPVTHSYVALPSGWDDYVTSFAGTYTFDTDGIAVLTDDTVYAIFDQFTGFTGGTYKVDFTTGTGAIDKALLLRNISTTDPGTFYAGMSQSPTWSTTYSGPNPEDITNNFPRTVSIGSAGTSRHIYAIYQMSGTVEAPAAIYSAPGLPLLSYTLTNPTDPPAFKRTIVTFYGDTLKTTTSIELIAPWENGWGGAA